MAKLAYTYIPSSDFEDEDGEPLPDLSENRADAVRQRRAPMTAHSSTCNTTAVWTDRMA